MKPCPSLIPLALLVAGMAVGVAAQRAANSAQTADELRLQLLDVQAKESELQSRVRQLDEDLKPENIARSLAGVGSTRPEELRESVRRQLTIERDGVLAQLKLVSTSRERLEIAVRTAENRAYQQSAVGTMVPVDRAVATRSAVNSPWMLGMAGGFVILLGIALLVATIRRLSI
jgi:hypothetical protein